MLPIFQCGSLIVDQNLAKRPFWQILGFIKKTSQANRMTVADENRHIVRICKEFRTWRRSQRLAGAWR